jgi:hypothetical protein
VSLYRLVLLDKLKLFGISDLDEITLDKIDKEFIGPYVYSIEWKDKIPVSIKPVFCDDFIKTGSDTWVALRENKFVSAYSNHQFIDCRISVVRERQLNTLISND